MKDHPLDATVIRLDAVWIPLADGTRLAATIWLPADAETRPVPAILEYLPYRRRDGTVLRDQQMHGWYARHGYAGVRVDIRGSGDSDGLLLDEYLPQEQEDAVEVIAWLAAQPWCSGTVGMIGISWGGFNGLQVAARRPPALKAIVTVCSTDDRYADDCHYMGGALLLNTFGWGSTLFAFGAQPPDPAVVGPRWREMWQERLENLPLFVARWIAEQRRGDYWKQGSVAEDYGAITAAVLAVGGWADGYSNAVPRLVSNLTAPAKGIIGPWAHAYPQVARPGPTIGFLQETLRWWDHWLKGIDRGVDRDPPFRVWLQESIRPATTWPERPGRWLALERWPVPGGDAPLVLYPAATGLATQPQSGTRVVSSPLVTGTTFGEWCPYGLEGELPQDQRPDDGRSLSFDLWLEHRLEILGAPVVEVTLVPDGPGGNIAARLSDVAPDGASTLVTYGLLNLTHRDGHEVPKPLVPGEPVTVRLQLNDIAHAFPAGHRVRLSLATAHWPTAWPAAAVAAPVLQFAGSRLLLPRRDPGLTDGVVAPFAEPEEAPGVPMVLHRPGARNRVLTEDPTTGRVTVTVHREPPSYDLPEYGLRFEAASSESYGLTEGDPLSASARSTADWRLSGKGWQTRTETTIALTCTAESFLLKASLMAWEGDREVARRDWDLTIPRDGV